MASMAQLSMPTGSGRSAYTLVAATILSLTVCSMFPSLLSACSAFPLSVARPLASLLHSTPLLFISCAPMVRLLPPVRFPHVASTLLTAHRLLSITPSSLLARLPMIPGIVASVTSTTGPCGTCRAPVLLQVCTSRRLLHLPSVNIAFVVNRHVLRFPRCGVGCERVGHWAGYS